MTSCMCIILHYMSVRDRMRMQACLLRLRHVCKYDCDRKVFVATVLALVTVTIQIGARTG